MLEIGDDVVVMSVPGRFQIIAIDGAVVTIESAEGIRKTVLASSVRRLAKRASA